jgi:hypothetical protein
MKSTKALFGLVALVLAVTVGAALFGQFHRAVELVASFSLLVGVVTVTYAFPVSGITAPTAIVMSKHAMLTATVAMADADTTATITHNWGLSTAQLADRFPVIIWNYVTAGTVPALLTFSRAANAVTVTKPNLANTGGTYEFTLLRPHTIIQ